MRQAAGAGAPGPAGAKSSRRKARAGQHVLLTGGTGFLGQAVLERLLSTQPDVRISLLVRSKGSTTGDARMTQLLRKAVFSRWIAEVGEDEAKRRFAKRVQVLEGSLTAMPSLPADIDVVIHSASTVSFDPPIDEAFGSNVLGAQSLYNALHATGSDPHVVHVSTAYVAGMRKGLHLERPVAHDTDWQAEADFAMGARGIVEVESREPDRLREFTARARTAVGKVGPQTTARAAEAARVEWVRARLVDQGRTRAQSLGWTDVYTLTKALAERVAEEQWRGRGHRLSVIRPSIIESALELPHPGWIDGYKVADPLIMAYGRGQLPEFPGLPDSVLDIIPVDFVVSAILAAAAAPPAAGGAEYYHVSSGASNPLPFHRMYELVREYFTANPVPRDDPETELPRWRFPGGAKIDRALQGRARRAAIASWSVARLPKTARTLAWGESLRAGTQRLADLRALTDLYRPYVQTEVIFDDREVRRLDEGQDASAERFDARRIDWTRYLLDVHFPAITSLTRAFASRPAAAQPRTTEEVLPIRPGIIAVFDFEGTVLESNLLQQYMLLWAADAPLRHPGAPFDLAFSLPRYARAERRDRGEFIRTFMRRYDGYRVEDIRRLADGAFKRALLKRTLPEAIAQVQAHRAAGHRTILVTGVIDLMVAPLAPFFDEVVAGRMHERDGVLTGYLAEPPLVDEARAAWLRDYAERNDIDLRLGYGYGDSEADIAWLSLLGNANAVNPDAALHRHATDRRWTIRRWRRGRHAVAAPQARPSGLEWEEGGASAMS